ncbi:MAG: DUF1905 domain-containing protein [Chloroflexota bacterium]
MLPVDNYVIDGIVEIFPQEGGWVYIQSPLNYSDLFKPFEERGLVAITANVGQSSWKTSLLPKGDGSHFIALPKKIRQKEQIQVGDQLRVKFKLRYRRE